ncbi:MAG TPA: PilZ domain-containing protein [Terriglobales bacterium]|nr:PilZ domain-containing protein [Terriglobales bacterium]
MSLWPQVHDLTCVTPGQGNAYHVWVMELRSLLLSRDAEMTDVLKRAMSELGIGVFVYTMPEWAGEDLRRHKFDAVIIDCDDLPEGVDVLQAVKNTPSNSDSMAFAIVNGRTSLQAALDMGAHLALEKPISAERAKSSFRAAYGLMVSERRRYFRYDIEAPVGVSLDEKTEYAGVAVNISEGGMALKMNCVIAPKSVAQLRFTLPGSSQVQLRAVVVWSDEQGRAGVRFEQVPAAARKHLAEWFAKQEAAMGQKPAE